MNKETQFFHDIAKACLAYVSGADKDVKIASYKIVPGDYATEIDIAVEKLIIEKISELFPNDAVMAEEGYADTKIGNSRIWVIDPICGTTNLGRGINAYCTNIALLESGKMIAACVVDYAQGEHIWSIGDGVYLKNNLLNVPRRDTGRIIDVDYGAVMKAPANRKKWYGEVVTDLSEEPGWMLSSMNSSLSFLYVVNRKIDAVLNISYNPWDICASAFLVQQAGGIITDFEGKEWAISSGNAILSMDKEVHDKVLDAIKRA